MMSVPATLEPDGPRRRRWLPWIHLLDAATVVALVRAMGSNAFRTLGILPVALSATLAFRGRSFWLPMLPGFVASRHLVRR